MSLSPGWSRSFRRLVLDLLEAIGGGPDVLDESASDGIGPGTLSDSIRRKYDEQAPFYRDTMIKSPIAIALPLLDEIHREVPPGRRILVAGSGAGRECFALSGEGWDVAGVDFSSSMVRLASEEAACRGLSARFQCSDLRVHEEPPRSLAAVLFTYDVYSFIPDSSDRVELLLKMRRWLEPGGVIFLSARRIHSNFERFILALQWFAAAFPDRKPSRSSDDRYPDFGWSHTRWISPNGVFQRSFVAHFTNARLRSEFLRAGLEAGSWRAGHCVLRPIR